MKYLSVCAGIEAASVAWHHMGWEPVAFSEIEKFPSAVLAHHYPNVPNWGDMTKFKEWPDANVDVLVGGTPCQSFSVAGLRKGLDDPRGNLMLTFGAIAQRYRPEWLVWENVPGVLSSNGGRDFGAFLGMLAELRYGFAYRVLDAQYFGVAQRRRRVFVVGYLGDWHRAAAVLFERHSLSGHLAPSRQARKGTAPGAASSTGKGCWWDGGDTAATLTTKSDDQRMPDKDNAQLVMQPRRLIPWTRCECCEDFWCNICDQHAYDCDCPPIDEWETDPYGLQEQGPAAQPVAIQGTVIGRSEHAGPQGSGADDSGAMFTLTKTDVHAVAVDFRHTDLTGDVTHTIQAKKTGGFSLNYQPGVMQPVPYDFYQITAPVNRQNRKPGDPCHTLARDNAAHATIVQPIGLDEEQNARVDGFGTLKARMEGGGFEGTVMTTTMQVRRLTPVECERLQGFPDGYTNIPWRGKPESPDGPRYKALGNSMAVPVMRWIGERINEVSKL